jgi:NADH-quinone oxidoreductase subunit N
MSVGNIMALRQTNVKRMFGISGISRWFYVDDFVEFVYIGRKFIYYTAAYSLSGIAAFSVILYVCKIEIMKMW